MASFIRTAKAAPVGDGERLRNRSFPEPTMADGEVELSELSARDDLSENVREPQVYDPHVAGDDEAARRVVRMGPAIGRSDGEFRGCEVDAARDPGAAPWLDPGDLGP